MNSFYHAQASARRWGGTPEDYQPIHDFIDSSKASVPDMRHRSMLHSSWGIYLVEQVFGNTLRVTKKRGGTKVVKIPTRLIAEHHVVEDLGFIPTMDDWLRHMTLEPWMSGAKRKQVSFSEFLTSPTPTPVPPLPSLPLDLHIFD